MSLWLIFFFTSYGALHAYLFVKIKTAFSLSPGTIFLLFLFFFFMVFSPLYVRLWEKEGNLFFVRCFAYFCYSWMGLVFFLFLLLLLFDALNIAHFLVGKKLFLSPFQQFSLSLFLAVTFFLYGLVEVNGVKLETVKINTAKLPNHVGKLRVVQISDLHLSYILPRKRLEKTVALVEQANPDMVISTGDLVDGQNDHLFDYLDYFVRLKPPLGKFAVTGNHEFYVGLKRSLNFLTMAGFRVLRGEGLNVMGLINLAGFDDKTISNPVSVRETLNRLPRGYFTLLLYHRPETDPSTLGFFDLQLSGHTHYGQIFPFRFFTGLFFPRQAGFFNLGRGSFLYVNRGAGTWGPPIRFLTPPEITIIDIESSLS